jgi:hypothetical protein
MKVLTAVCSTLVLVSVPTAAAPVPKGAQSANLVVNGSFEEGPEFEVCKPLDKGSDAMKGWVVTPGRSTSPNRTRTSGRPHTASGCWTCRASQGN